MSGNRGGYYDDTSPGSEAEAIERGEVTPVTPEPYTREELELEALTLSAIHRGFMNAGHHQAAEKFLRLCTTARAGLDDRERTEWLLAHLWFGVLEVEPSPGICHRLVFATGDRDQLRPDWRRLIDAARNKETARSGSVSKGGRE